MLGETTHLQRPGRTEVGNIRALHAHHSGEIESVCELEPRHILSDHASQVSLLSQIEKSYTNWL